MDMRKQRRRGAPLQVPSKHNPQVSLLFRTIIISIFAFYFHFYFIFIFTRTACFRSVTHPLPCVLFFRASLSFARLFSFFSLLPLFLSLLPGYYSDGSIQHPAKSGGPDAFRKRGEWESKREGGNNNNNNNNKIHTQTHSESTTKTFRDVFFSPARSPAVRRTHNWSKAKKERVYDWWRHYNEERGGGNISVARKKTVSFIRRDHYATRAGWKGEWREAVSLSCSSISSHPTRGDVTAAGQKKKKSTETQRERERESGSFRLPSSWWKSSLIHLNDVGPPHGAGN